MDSGEIFVSYSRRDSAYVKDLVAFLRAAGPANSFSYEPSISADGRYVTFYSLASNLVAGDSNGVTIRLREAHDDFFVAPLRARLAWPDADLRARLAASMIGGLLYSLWAVGDEALAATAHAEIVATYAPLLQQLITPAR